MGLSSDIVQKLAPYFRFAKRWSRLCHYSKSLTTFTWRNHEYDQRDKNVDTNVGSKQIRSRQESRCKEIRFIATWNPHGDCQRLVADWFTPKISQFLGSRHEKWMRKGGEWTETFLQQSRRPRARWFDKTEQRSGHNRSSSFSSVDLVFSLDESGSVGATNFQKSLDFVRRLIGSFPEENLRGENGTRFGLSTFSSSYSTKFHLYDYTNQPGYFSAITRVRYSGGGTKLGFALGTVLTDQFSERRSLGPKADGLPRILVLTDGKSHDNVSKPAKTVRDNEITIYAVGVARYDLESNLKRSYHQINTSSPSTLLKTRRFCFHDHILGMLRASGFGKQRNHHDGREKGLF